MDPARTLCLPGIFLLVTAAAVMGSPNDAPEAEPGWRRLFDRADRDGDGKVTREELNGVGRRSEWIARADRDGDGKATWEETRAFFESLRGNASEANEEGEVLVLAREFPAESPVTLRGARAAAAYSAEQGGLSFLLMVRGEVVYEQYENGRKPEDAHRLASGTKSFSGAMLAAAAQDGLLASDEKVAATITEWKDDPALSKITLRQLLSLTSGIAPGTVGKISSYREAIAASVVSAPEKAFRYGPNAFQIFGEVMRRKLVAAPSLGVGDPLSYLEARIFEPIGMATASWRKDENGMPHLPSGAFLTARDWAKYGEFLRRKGEWKGTQLVDRAVLEECLVGSQPNPLYGLTFWLLDDGRKNAPSWEEGAFMAAGAGKQRLLVIPAKEVVVVRQGESRRFENGEFLGRLFSTGRKSPL